jgi:hypothetical protein
MVLKLGQIGKQIRNTWEVLKCGAGEGWRRSVGWIVCEMRKYNIELRVEEERNILHTTKRSKTNCIGHILRRNCSKTHFWGKDRRNDRRDGKTRTKR